MRILHVYKSYYPDSVGGIEQVIAQLVRGLAAQGHDNRIFTLSPDPNPPVLHLPEGEVHRSRETLNVASNNVSIAALKEFRSHLMWADVVHYQFPWPFGDLLHLLRARGKPSILTYQSDVVRQKALLQLYRPLMNRFLRSVDAVVATSPQYLASSSVLRQLQALARTRVIPNGMNETGESVPQQALIGAWRQRVGEGFMLFVGVLRYYKGLQTLLQAAEGFEGRIVIAGSGPERDLLEAQSRQLGLKNVCFVGQVTDRDKACLYYLARAFVFPSHLRSEAFGMSLVEASMAARPMITCEIGTGTTFINVHGETGLAVPPEDPVALRDALRALHFDEVRAAAWGRAARARYEAVFTADAMARAYMNLYREVLATRR